jgi:hypothetical protein
MDRDRRTDSSQLAACDCPDAALIAERSVPVSGFSRELRACSDVERYWFSFALRDEFDCPVHVVFSASARRAEIKAGDLKVQVLEGVGSACEAKRRWIEWWRKGRTARSFSAPRRTGRVPLAVRASS